MITQMEFDAEVKELGMYAAALKHTESLRDQEPAYCPQCGQRNAIWDNRCRQCGGEKKWVYPRDMTPAEIQAGRERLNAVGRPATQRNAVTNQRGIK